MKKVKSGSSEQFSANLCVEKEEGSMDKGKSGPPNISQHISMMKGKSRSSEHVHRKPSRRRKGKADPAIKGRATNGVNTIATGNSSSSQHFLSVSRKEGKSRSSEHLLTHHYKER